ncbi:hypothetical protein DPMN_111433 [Dreissena polymorpha]|uniref:Ras-associating domain-containing protein n=1 Tax=Dreissena polymorpha TaxID=45954 RepID=A0A9D4KDW4_DREPO|nr:hypothetical protein DPMN_111433 [Dreissena polymorpha]
MLKVTKYTTCDDVIEMLAHLQRINIRTVDYCVYEITSHLHRAIQGRELLVKVWRSWGCESDRFSFLVDRKQIHCADPRSFRLKLLSPESQIDELFLKSACTQQQSNPNQKIRPANKDVNSRSTSNKGERSGERKTGKEIVFAKFFSDLRKSKSKLSRFSSKLFSSTADSYCDVNATLSLKNLLHQRCRNVWDQYIDSESEASWDCSSLTASTSDDDSFDSTDSSDFVRESISKTGLDKAFMKSPTDSNSDEGIDVTSMTSVDLNSAFVGDVDAMHCSHMSQRHSLLSIKDFDRVASSNKLNRKLSDDDFLKELFGCHGSEHVVSEDDAMESFMRSRLDSF